MLDGTTTLKEVFASALEFESEERRSAYLSEACSDDPQLLADVRSLLAAHGSAGSFLSGVGREAELIAPPLFDPEGSGTDIGPYKLREKIGEGGMGVVYVAEQTRPFRRMVALKLIKPGMDSREVVARFEAERQALALMDHPNIARVLDAGTTGEPEGDDVSPLPPSGGEASDMRGAGRPFFVMELVRGVSITEYCDEARLGTRDRLKLFVTVCLAVQHAHQKGVIHRDLKPGNVLVTLHDGVPVPKVIDFGVAKALNQELTERTIYTQFRQMVGTPMYMSPEQAEMSGLDVDTRSDVYSLGVLLYELLTGTPPFDKQTLMSPGFDEMRRIIREDEPPRPSQRVSTLNASAQSTLMTRRGVDVRELSHSLRRELDWIVMRAMEKDRARRYESASALAKDVQRYLDDEPVEACPPTWTYQLRKQARRHKGVITAAGLVLLSLAIGLVASVVLALRAVDSERQAERATEEYRDLLYASDMILASRDWRQNDTQQARNRLARHIPQPGEHDLRGFEWHYLWKQGEVPGVELANTGHAVYDIKMSPDGEQFAVVGADAIIRGFDVAGGQFLFSIPTDQGETNGVAFSPDSRRLAAAGDDGTIRVWDVASRDQLLNIPAHSSLAYQVVFSPDGTVLASCGEDHKVLLWNAASGSALGTLNEHETAIETIAISPNGIVAAGDKWARVTLWDLPNRQPLQVPEERGSDAVSAVSFSADEFVARGTVDGQLSVAGVENRSVAYQRRFANGIQSVDFAPGGSWLAVGDRAGQVLTVPIETGVWDLGATRQWPAHDGRVYAVAVTPDAERIISGGSDGRVMSWELFSGTPSRIIRLEETCKNVAALDDGRIAVGAIDCVLILDREGEFVDRLSDRPGAWFVESVPAGGILVAESGTEVVGWDTADYEQVFQFDVPGVSGIEPTPDGRTLVMVVEDSDRDRVFQVRDALSGDIVAAFPVRSAKTFDISPDGRWLAFDSDNGIRLYDLESKQFVSNWDAHRGAIRNLRFHPDGRQLVSVSADRMLKTWSLPEGELIHSATAHRTEATRCAISPDGQRIATGGDDRMLRLWDARSLQLVWEHPLQFGQIVDLCFTSDSRRLACLCGDHDLLILDGSPAADAPQPTTDN